MSTNIRFRDDNGNRVDLIPREPQSLSEIVDDVAKAGLVVAIVVIACIILL